MNVSLTPEQETYLKQKVSTGGYHSVSEVVREALRLLETQDAVAEAKLNALRSDLQQGIDSLDRGEGRPFNVAALKATARQMKSAT